MGSESEADDFYADDMLMIGKYLTIGRWNHKSDLPMKIKSSS